VDRRLGIGIDIGATKVRACVGDAEGKILWRKSSIIPLPEHEEDFVKEIISVVRNAAKQVPSRAGPAGIGVASAGPLDLGRGGMASPANLPYGFVPIVRPLEERFGTEVRLMNDASAAALGESRFGAGRRCDNLVYVTLSTGIGGGAIVDGHLLSGKDGNAAEIGHVVVDPTGRLPCGCGGKGHWEAYCSGRGIPRFAALIAGKGRGPGEGSSLGGLARGPRELDSAAIFRAAARRNGAALKVVKEVGRFNAVGVANAVNMFDPSLVTIGGGVALNNPDMVLGPIRSLVPKYSVNRAPKIMITPLGDDAGLLGALSLAFGESSD
jgi:glucokinase